jgi:hypothetical protein
MEKCWFYYEKERTYIYSNFIVLTTDPCHSLTNLLRNVKPTYVFLSCFAWRVGLYFYAKSFGISVILFF